jgi:hypothetical protein
MLERFWGADAGLPHLLGFYGQHDPSLGRIIKKYLWAVLAVGSELNFSIQGDLLVPFKKVAAGGRFRLDDMQALNRCAAFK